jgi:hypothetical protein
LERNCRRVSRSKEDATGLTFMTKHKSRPKFVWVLSSRSRIYASILYIRQHAAQAILKQRIELTKMPPCQTAMNAPLSDGGLLVVGGRKTRRAPPPLLHCPKLLPRSEGTRSQIQLTLKDSIGGLIQQNRTSFVQQSRYRNHQSGLCQLARHQPCNQNAPGASPSIPRCGGRK